MVMRFASSSQTLGQGSFGISFNRQSQKQLISLQAPFPFRATCPVPGQCLMLQTSHPTLVKMQHLDLDHLKRRFETDKTAPTLVVLLLKLNKSLLVTKVKLSQNLQHQKIVMSVHRRSVTSNLPVFLSSALSKRLLYFLLSVILEKILYLPGQSGNTTGKEKHTKK